MRFFEALLFKPNGDFIVRDNGCTGSFYNGFRVFQMVVMSMGNENVICRNLRQVDSLRQLVFSDVGIEEQILAANFYTKARVPIISYLHNARSCCIGISPLIAGG